jgi:hypothetical protein
LAQQGIKISIRKGRRIRGIKPHRPSNDNDESDEDSRKTKKPNKNEAVEPGPDLDTSSHKPTYRRIHISSFLSSSP